MKSKLLLLAINTALIYGCAETNTAHTSNVDLPKETVATENKKTTEERNLFLERIEAAEKGDVDAQVRLAATYSNGNGTITPKDISKQIYWLEKAANQGETFAQFSLGLIYLNGEEVPKNTTEALKWFTLAGRKSNVKSPYMNDASAQAQDFVGSIYAMGDGVPQNYKEAIKWYQLAADQGLSSAQYSLGSIYEMGNGVPKNYKEAIKWYRLAAQQGEPFAQYNLGTMYYRGKGTPKDAALGYMLINLSAATRNKLDEFDEFTLKIRDTIEREMSREDVLLGQELSAKWQVGTPLPMSSH